MTFVASAAARPARAVVLGLLLIACGGDEAASGRDVRPGEASPAGPVTVLAAASLTEVFDALGTELERRHPGVQVRFSFAASSTLAAQAAAGAPGDILATADRRTMQAAARAGAVEGEPIVFARNMLVIVVPRGNPGRIRSPADLGRPDVKVSLCARQVPCGAAAARALGEAGVGVTPATWDRDVKAVLAKVVLDEVDAGLVYATDARAAGEQVVTIPLSQAEGAKTTYMMAVLRQSPNPAGGRAFVDLVRSEAGRTALDRAGFEVLEGP